MNATQYAKLMDLIATAREKAENLQEEMRILNRHGGEEAYANSDIVYKKAESMEKDLGKALDTLRQVGVDRLKISEDKS